MFYKVTALALFALLGSSSAYAIDDGLVLKIGEKKSNKIFETWVSDELRTENNGEEKLLLLGTKRKIFFCSLSSSAFYRHGDPSRGLLGCKVYTEGDNWYLSATGPSQTTNPSAGLAYAACRAICIK